LIFPLLELIFDNAYFDYDRICLAGAPAAVTESVIATIPTVIITTIKIMISREISFIFTQELIFSKLISNVIQQLKTIFDLQ
jgi:hypothetical protein